MIFCVLQIKLLVVAKDIPFSSSKTTCSISATTCWILKSKGTPLMMSSLHFKAHKKLNGCTGLVKFFFIAMLRLIACSIAVKCLILKGLCSRGLAQDLRCARWNFHDTCFP